MFVNVNFHTNAGKVGDTVRYVAHREETLPEGRTREIYGIDPATGSCGGRGRHRPPAASVCAKGEARSPQQRRTCVERAEGFEE
jgi:hypothetical protein